MQQLNFTGLLEGDYKGDLLDITQLLPKQVMVNNFVKAGNCSQKLSLK